MKIVCTKKLLKSVTPVFILREKEKPEKHLFFQQLSKSDQEQLHLFGKHTHLEGIYTHTVFLLSGRRALVMGIGKEYNHRKAIRTMRRIISVARKERMSSLVVNLGDFRAGKKVDVNTLAEILATQLELANFEFVMYKTKPKEGWFFVKEVHVFTPHVRNVQANLNTGKIIGEEINDARALSNTPGGDMTPQKLAEAAQGIGHRTGCKVRILTESAIKKLKMGGILGVSRGSSEQPRFIVMEYLKGKKSEKPIVLVGKGVTFDTGGLNLKQGNGIYEMHMDMSGGAAVIHTLAALVRLKVKKNIICLIPAVENMPSGSSYHPGDLLKTMSGKTIEVLNTDAEGRVILADALTYAERYAPRLVIDVATLTGAAMVALGQRASALFTTNTVVEKKLRQAGEVVGDLLWPLPLWEEYEEEVKGTFGDVANMGKTKYGGAITGAVFLWQFAKQYPWVHIDIAPRMTTIEGEYLAKGAAGASIGLLVSFVRDF
ncbi:MAG TPA: leucyl aminopeptidase [Candidatus Jorgensenbacteria bacterium]|nr:leucyl aminopeptidase [Candidatus Jorgensenbacteria bacterium]